MEKEKVIERREDSENHDFKIRIWLIIQKKKSNLAWDIYGEVRSMVGICLDVVHFSLFSPQTRLIVSHMHI